ncbi:peroxisomal 2,4-dienoyl-CoA reductase [(3E)-enoyl-CoA-producing]-like isoform X2 [Mya arenaria]|uniref:peroxisomal 2,4-dienoyl-CoA reductase [(3E)-enoyl-CoA-producing]-like isoform X2 n=1 Tax=Mya arenaria TaxID=6604 RepID=UPI0022E17AD2|nr:peroxisomal 2,4-dienoyl-CoA reductase [(3E)-enoyl-CoA-producing]-like isoform X2 [Mya arenaria]
MRTSDAKVQVTGHGRSRQTWSSGHGGKVAFVTGGGTGIGFTIAEVLMRHGCDTVIASRRLDKLQESAATLRAATGRRCLPIQMDVRDPKKVQAAVAEAMKEFGKINILVNSAAGNFLCPAEGLSFNAFRTVMDIDAMGTYNVTKVVFDEYMKKHGGVIVNITATLQVRGQVYQLHAGAAKAAIETMTKHLAVEWGEKGIRIMCVAPGPIGDTEGFSRLGGKALRKEYVDNIPIQRVGTREDIANTVVYVCSDAAQLLTGSTVIADGGSWLTNENNLSGIRHIVELYSKM